MQRFYSFLQNLQQAKKLRKKGYHILFGDKFQLNVAEKFELFLVVFVSL